MATIQEAYKQALEKPISELPTLRLVLKELEDTSVKTDRVETFFLAVYENKVVMVRQGHDPDNTLQISTHGLLSDKWEIEKVEKVGPVQRVATKKSYHRHDDDEDED